MSSSAAKGAPKTTMSSSPIILSKVPLCLNTISIISEKYSLSVITTCSGSIFSDIEVKPLISVNNIVTSLSSPPKLSFVSSSNRLSTTCLETYLLNVFLTLLTSDISSMAITNPSALPLISILGAADTLTIVS